MNSKEAAHGQRPTHFSFLVWVLDLHFELGLAAAQIPFISLLLP